MKDQILKAIELYVSEPQTEGYEIRAIPSPEVLVEFIMESINRSL